MSELSASVEEKEIFEKTTPLPMLPQNDRRKTSYLYNDELPPLSDEPAEPPPEQTLDPTDITASSGTASFNPIFEEEANINSMNTSPAMDFSYPRMQNTPILDEHLALDYERDRIPFDLFNVSPAMGAEFSSLNPLGYTPYDPSANTNSAGSSSGSALNIPSAPPLTEGIVRQHLHNQPQQPHGLNGPMGHNINDMLSSNNLLFLSGNYTARRKWDDDDSHTSPRNHFNASTHTTASKAQPARAKSAHNLIEQRYRNKINDRFTALQMLVPTLRVISRKSQKNRTGSEGSRDEEEEDEDDMCSPLIDPGEDLEGLEPARKLNKGTILAKSIEYIKFLERKNERIKMEHRELLERARMMGLQIDESLLGGQG